MLTGHISVHCSVVHSFQPIYQGTGQMHKVNKLSESTEYHFRIYAANEAGDGPVSAVQTCRTTKAPPPAPKRKYTVVVFLLLVPPCHI